MFAWRDYDEVAAEVVVNRVFAECFLRETRWKGLEYAWAMAELAL